MIENIFFIELAAVLLVATLLGLLFQKFKQPVILAYIVTGIILGSSFLDIITYKEMLSVFSELGIAFLLFVVGINLNPKILKDVGKTSVITGLGQIFFTCSVGFLISTFLGFNLIESMYISIALTFSSTIIIIKILSDKHEINSLYGKTSVGFLLVQDFVAIIALMLITSISTTGSIEEQIIRFFGNIIIFVILFFVFSKILSKKYFTLLAKNQELLFIGSITWCLIFTSLAIFLGLSKEIGAFIAGIILSQLEYSQEIINKMKYLRDFFIVLFFVILGSNLVFVSSEITIIPAIIFSLFVLIGNPIIVFILMIFLGHKGRTSFLSSLTVAQISEFSLILIFLGQKVGHLSDQIVPMVTLVGIITISMSTYMIVYNNKIYSFLQNHLKILKTPRFLETSLHLETPKKYDLICIGFEDAGQKILSDQHKNKKILIIDFDPNAVIKAKNEEYDAVYGDVSNLDTIESIITSNPKIILSTIMDLPTNIFLTTQIKKQINTKIIALANDKHEAKKFYSAGMDYVLVPNILTSEKVNAIIHDLNKGKNFELNWIEDELKKDLTD